MEISSQWETKKLVEADERKEKYIQLRIQIEEPRQMEEKKITRDAMEEKKTMRL